MSHGHILPACIQHQSVSPFSKYNILKTVLSGKRKEKKKKYMYIYLAGVFS